MGIRGQAILWLEQHHRRPQGPIYTSKYYKPEESWPKKSVWWFQIPISAVEENRTGSLHLICQGAPNENTFHYLKVPAIFLSENLHLFHIVEDKISMYLSTESENLFVEIRGTGKLDFSSFLVAT